MAGAVAAARPPATAIIAARLSEVFIEQLQNVNGLKESGRMDRDIHFD
jgi:hypothetical protein